MRLAHHPIVRFRLSNLALAGRRRIPGPAALGELINLSPIYVVQAMVQNKSCSECEV
jgi:hypothetical protein